MRVLDAVGTPRGSFVYASPRAHNADSIDLLRARGCVLAVTNTPDLARSRRMRCSRCRVWTPTISPRTLAPPDEWTLRA
jgi:hypothetical protein